MDRTYSMILQEESHKELKHHSERELDATALAVGVKRKENKSALYCNKCKKSGHSTERCMFCLNCNKPGHTIETCYKIHGYPERGSNRKAQGSGIVANVTSEGKIELSNEQIYQLLALAEEQKSKKKREENVSSTSTPLMMAESNNAGIYCNLHKNISTWIIDSGATHHVVCNKNLLTHDVRNVCASVKLPNQHTAEITHIGNIMINKKITLKNVLCVPTFKVNLMSVSKAAIENDLCFIFNKNKCSILQKDLRDSSRVIGESSEERGLYFLKKNKCCVNSIECKPKILAIRASDMLWHFRMGHAPLSRLSLIEAISFDVKNKDHAYCNICPKAMQKRKSFPTRTTVSSYAFEMLHCDLWGPFSVPTINQQSYFLTVVDDYSRMTWIHLLKFKSEVKSTLIQFIEFLERQFEVKIKKLRTDKDRKSTRLNSSHAQ